MDSNKNLETLMPGTSKKMGKNFNFFVGKHEQYTDRGKVTVTMQQ